MAVMQVFSYKFVKVLRTKVFEEDLSNVFFDGKTSLLSKNSTLSYQYAWLIKIQVESFVNIAVSELMHDL